MGKIGIIIRREFNERVRKKSFIITTLLTPLLLIGIMAASVYIAQMKSDELKEILVVDASGIIAPELQSGGDLMFTDTNNTPDEIRSGKSAGEHPRLYGILVIGKDIMENPRDVQLYTYAPSTIDVESSIAKIIADIIESEKLKAYDIQNLPEILEQVKTKVSLQSFRIDDSGKEKESSSGLAMGLAYVFGLLIYMFVFNYGAMVMHGVIEEKSSRVLEIIVSSVKPFQLMMGKILGIASVAITQFLIWVFIMILGGMAMSYFMANEMAGAAQAAADGGAASMGGMNMDPQMFAAINNLVDPSFLITLLGGFLVFFIGGYLLYAAMFAAIGSAVDNSADSQQLQLPLTIPMILAIIVMINVMREPNSSMAVWFSMIPFTSPIIMMARLPYGVPLWEMALSAVILYASFIIMVWLAGKVYRVGIFMYGKKPTFKELIKWTKYKY